MIPLKKTALHALHIAQRAHMGEFAGYDMPIFYSGMGVLKEHMFTRESAGIFDVSHMGQYEIRGADSVRFIEWVTPIDMARLPPGHGALTMLTNAQGGIKDDCIVTKFSDTHLFVVLNAGCKEKDVAHLEAMKTEFKGDVHLIPLERSLIALQGPKSASILSTFMDDISTLYFMEGRQNVSIKGIPVQIMRCGYTGEDGFEIVVSNENAGNIVDLLLQKGANLVGLGARDSLRLEAGLNLYGHELSEEINPVAARFMWSISKCRIQKGGFIGWEKIKNFKENPETVPRLRIGVQSTGPVAREGTIIEIDGKPVGILTSGCPSPCLKKNIGLGTINRQFAKKGTKVELVVRGRHISAEVVTPPFVPTKYYHPK